MKPKTLLSILFVYLVIGAAHCKFDEPPLGSDPSSLKATPAPNDALPDAGQQNGADGGFGGGGMAGMGGAGGMVAECIIDSDCLGETTECKWPACVDGQCTMHNADYGTPLFVQVYGDCAMLRCDGWGNVFADYFQDPYRDDNECTSDVCYKGVTLHSTKAKGTWCYLPTITSKSGWCNGDANNPQCVQCIPNMKPCSDPDWICVDGFCQPPTP